MNDNYKLFKLVRAFNNSENKSNVDLAIETIVAGTSSNNQLGQQIKKITVPTIIEGTSADYAFYNCSQLEEISEINTDNVTSMSHTFKNCKKLKKLPKMNTSNVTIMWNICENCESLEEISLDMSNVGTLNTGFAYCKAATKIELLNANKLANLGYAFMSCSKLKTLDAINAENIVNIEGIFYNDWILENLGGFINLGKKYNHTRALYTSYNLNLADPSKLTHQSLMNVINNLYDLNLSYKVASGGTLYTQGLYLGSTNLAKLTADEIAIATAKGWSVLS